MGCTIWLTGLSGSGKTTIANLLCVKLKSLNYNSCILDGDDLRKGLCQDLGFSLEGRKENIRRVAEVAKILRACSVLNIVSFISPFREDRKFARSLCSSKDLFIEVFVDCPIQICAIRDTKGLYKKAYAREIKDFTGVTSPYEAPEQPDIHLYTTMYTVEDCVQIVLDHLRLENYGN